ncbi:MAG: hypothetical protein QOH38_561, partial [Thermoleophilaceae bacterium]|nr:hypothetical protein [Thermoleophilaceae bacterium]
NPDCRILVNSEVDAPDANPGDGECLTAAGKCTLRAAVQEANASGDRPPFQSKILVPAGHYTLTRHGLDDTADRGDLDLNFVGEIVGAGQGRTVVDGDGADRVFDLRDFDQRVAHLAVRNGRATDGPGGGIRAVASDYLEYLYVTDNEAVPGEATDSGRGGGIAGTDTNITYSVVNYNDAQDGGGLYYRGAQSGFGSDTFAYNHATRDGGGIYYTSSDSYFNNVTISGNSAAQHGGGLFLSPIGASTFVDLAGSTIASNQAGVTKGGGIWLADVPELDMRAAGTVVANNSQEDCAGPGTLRSLGGNVASDDTCGFGTDTDHAGVDPLLRPLAYNGGPVQTRALKPDSPAIDAWQCTGADFNEPKADARGAARPQFTACDAGAYEVGQCCPKFEPPFKPGSDQDPTPKPPVSYCGRILHGTAGPDVMVGDPRRNELHGGSGDDRIFGRGNGDCLYGGRGKDFLAGGHGADALFGRSGNDRISGGDQEDFIIGGPGGDRILGGSDDDRLYGSGGGDYIRGGDGYDTISGGPGNDVIDAAGRGLDKVDCGSGNDRVRAKRLEHLYNCEHVHYVD